VLIPEDGTPQTRIEHWLRSGNRDVRQIFLLVLLATCAVIFLGNANIFAHRIGAAAVAVLAALLLTELVGRRSGRQLFGGRRNNVGSAPLYYGPSPAPSGWAEPAPSGWAGAGTSTMPLPMVEPVRPDRSWLSWLTFGILVITAGVLSGLATNDIAHPQPADVLAVCVAICGLGLVAGAFAGRAYAMIPIGILLVLGLGVTDALPRDLTWTAGTRQWAPSSTDLAARYVLGAGKADLDLTQLAAGANVDARVGAGRLMVFVPAGVGLDIDAKVSGGRVYAFGREQDGSGVHFRRVVDPTRPGAGTLHLKLQDGFGDIEIHTVTDDGVIR
jgi:hypothetical protein